MEERTGDIIDSYIYDLIKYYRDKGLTIIGLNDSQGVNITTTFFKKGLLDYLAYALTDDTLKPQVINAFSLTMNKTEHIDYFLKNNLSLEEIKLSQIYSVVSAFEKVMKDIGLPKCLGQLGNLYKLVYNPKYGDEQIKITTSLRESQEPIVIYSSGVNDLMREVGGNPFGIKKSYKERDKKPNYYYTLEKTNNPYSLKKVIDSIDRNFNNILSINEHADIYTLGAYVPKSLQSSEMDIFRNLIIAYNEELENLCKKYEVTFIDTENIGKEYNNSKINFHISSQGHNVLAENILEHIYENKIVLNKQNTYKNIIPFEITNQGPVGIIKDIINDKGKNLVNLMKTSGHQRNREKDIIDEHRREIEIFEKVLSCKK